MLKNEVSRSRVLGQLLNLNLSLNLNSRLSVKQDLIFVSFAFIRGLSAFRI